MNNLEKIKKSVLVLDIETSSQYPDGKHIDISTNFDDYVQYAKCKWLGMYSYKFDEYNKLNIANHNKEDIQDYIAKHDVIVGFNSEEFDVPILYNNYLMPKKKFRQVDCLCILGAATFYRHDGLPFKNRGVLMGYKFKRNSLKHMTEVMNLETQKGDIDYKIFFKDEWTKEETKDIEKYLESDVRATKQMFDKLWDFWMPFTEFISEANVNNLSWIRSSIASLTYKAACHKLGVEETYAENPSRPKEEMGGRVIAPKYEEARGIWYVDFASLYPHIYAMFNLFSEFDLETHQTLYNHTPDKLWHGNDMFKVKGYYDISGQHPLSQDVAEKLRKRMKLKKEDPDNPLIYTYKIFLNSLYGAQRSPIFEQIHTPNGGWDCCWLGQQINQYTEKRMADFGFETIAGDTDSIFVQLIDREKLIKNWAWGRGYNGDDAYESMTEEFKHNVEKQFVESFLQTIVNEIMANVPFPSETFKIDIENYLDYVMWPFDLAPIKGEDGKNLKNEKGRLIKELKGKKKNYVYIYGDKIKIMGLPIIKDNATPLGRRILEETLKPEIIKRKSAKFTKGEINVITQRWLEKPEAIELLAREFKVKEASSYKKESQIQAQISVGYFGGQSGVVSLIKTSINGNPDKKGYRKVGRAGKTNQYVTPEEALEAKLGMKDLDLTKLNNELGAFVKNE